MQVDDNSTTNDATQPEISEEQKPEDEDKNDGMFDCNICFEQATEPVITVCGHLFCWPCLYRWTSSQQNANLQCPVCKAGIQKDKIIPIYGRGRDTPSADINKAPNTPTEENIPNRPRGHRPDAPANPNYNPFAGHPFFGGGNTHAPFLTFGGMHNIQFSDIRSLFPFGNQVFGNQQIAPESLDPQNQQRAFLSRVLMFIGVLMLMVLLVS
jgi:E3 ubiquitin-protein ligase RNF5